jgi:hypothetical protein
MRSHAQASAVDVLLVLLALLLLLLPSVHPSITTISSSDPSKRNSTLLAVDVSSNSSAKHSR